MIYDLLVEASAKPTDWKVGPLKDLADVVGGGTPDTNVPEFWNPETIPWVTPSDISSSDGPVLQKTDRSISEVGLRNSSARLMPIGTTLLTSRATIGECRMAGMAVATNQGFASLVPKNGTDSDFLFYLAQLLRPAFARIAAGTTFVEISRREVRRVNVCVPLDPEERREIGCILRAADDAIAEAGKKLNAARRLKISLLQQLFSRGLPGQHTRFKQTKIGEVPESWEVMMIRCVLDGTPFNGVSPQSRPDPPGTPILNVRASKTESAVQGTFRTLMSIRKHKRNAGPQRAIFMFCAGTEIGTMLPLAACSQNRLKQARYFQTR